jgi:hypothetical protein
VFWIVLFGHAKFRVGVDLLNGVLVDVGAYRYFMISECAQNDVMAYHLATVVLLFELELEGERCKVRNEW